MVLVRIGVAMVSVALLASALLAEEPKKLATAKEFQQYGLARTFAVRTKMKDGRAGIGTGFFLEGSHYVTANHVVEQREAISICVPAFDEDGELKRVPPSYPDDVWIDCEVIRSRGDLDLALLKPKRTPKIKPFPIPERFAKWGSGMATLGNSEFGTKGLWVFRRQGLPEKVCGQMVPLGGVIKNRVLEGNLWLIGAVPGDSGGPLYDEYGHLRGIVLTTHAALSVDEIKSWIENPDREVATCDLNTAIQGSYQFSSDTDVWKGVSRVWISKNNHVCVLRGGQRFRGVYAVVSDRIEFVLDEGPERIYGQFLARGGTGFVVDLNDGKTRFTFKHQPEEAPKEESETP